MNTPVQHTATELVTLIGRLTMLNDIDIDILEDASEVGSMELARLASNAIADRTKEITALQTQLKAVQL
jgi:hypothetical protein